MTERPTQCENRYRTRVPGNRGVVDRCSRNATTTVWRLEDDGEGTLRVATREVCGTCANRLTTGSQREPTNPWRRRGER
jgi:hypothetical protein